MIFKIIDSLLKLKLLCSVLLTIIQQLSAWNANFAVCRQQRRSLWETNELSHHWGSRSQVLIRKMRNRDLTEMAIPQGLCTDVQPILHKRGMVCTQEHCHLVEVIGDASRDCIRGLLLSNVYSQYHLFTQISFFHI